MSIVGKLHDKIVYNRRMTLLAERLAAIIPENAKVLDVGCGDGKVDSLILKLRPDISICGIDVLIRDNTYIQVSWFDGETIPYDNGSFDVVMFVDVLHHTNDPEVLIKEAKRVSKQFIVLKDHTKDGVLATFTLKFMDWVGNAHYGVVLPYNYWTKRQWNETFNTLGITVEKWDNQVGLYPWPATLVFDRSLHFIAKLTCG